MSCRNPFPLPDRLDATLQSSLSFWQGLRRGESPIPFSDDLALSALSNLSGMPFLLSAFASPERFRFEFVSEILRGAAAAGGFIDEMSPDDNFCYLRAQSSGTIEAAEPTFLRLTEKSGRSFSRLLLPMWEDGQVDMLLGVFGE